MSKDFLVLSFSPSQKFLSTIWQRPVSSEEYRHGIRTIAVCIATLGVQLVVIDFSKMGTPSEQDQNCTANFLKQALSNTSLRRSARVLSENMAQRVAYDRIMSEPRELPYETKAFMSYSEATEWLFNETGTPKDMVDLPMPSSTSDLRKQMNSRLVHDLIRSNTSETEAADLTKIVCQTNFAEITVRKQENLLSLRWLRPVESREYRYAILKTMRVLKTQQLEKMLVINQRLGVATLDDQKWLLGMAIETFLKCRLQHLAIVSSCDTLQQMASEKIGKKMREANLLHETRYFIHEGEALEWLMQKENGFQVRQEKH